MNLAEELSIIEAFARSAAARRKDVEREFKEARLLDEQERRQEREEKARDALVGILLATDYQVDVFREDLCRYDAAVTDALINNENALAASEKRLHALLSKGFRLPDGRTAFRSLDGASVFDNLGQQVASDIVDPDSIGNDRPPWEAFRDARDLHEGLLTERTELLEFQNTVDEARERLDSGDVSAGELDSLKASLETAMPDAVKLKLAEQPQDHNPGLDADHRNSAAADPSSATRRNAPFPAPL